MNKILKKGLKRFSAIALALVMAGTAVPVTQLTNVEATTAEAAASTTTTTTEDSSTVHFSWNNLTSYFVLTDRFKNGTTDNDNSYGRGLDQSGNAQAGLDYTTNPGTFHGGDLQGLTETVKEGYFTDLGVNAIWITAPYEQIHGFTSGNVNGDSATSSNGLGFPYYSYHGYWTLDYTNIDANMGTEEDFKEFVTACHERGIRVIMDVVLNHVGYATIKDLEDAGMDDALTSDAASYYYGNVTDLVGGLPESTTYYNLDSTDWAEKWWGTDFVRVASDYAGYTNVGRSAGWTSTLCGLPDVITEGTSDVALPPILANKWTEEGRYEEETAELDEFFNETGYVRSASNYIIKWLTDYVREYGIDGFRCDTAAHVEYDSWNRLHEQGVIALNEWRENNPDEPGADWTDDFWMTGEAWGHGVGKDAYYTTANFDSMINFTFPKNGNLSNIESVYSSYASTINSDDDFNVLSYLTSHDDNAGKSLFGTDAATNMNAGTSLLLSPGGVQIFYGNETNRGLDYEDFFTGSDYLDQLYRSDMNWDDYDETILAHWQKLGQFRNKHVSIGAGEHQQLDGDVYTFARTYNLEEEDEDKVVVALPQAAGTYTISVGDVFDDGDVLTDYYSGKTYTVSNGTVTATTTAATDPILLQGSGVVKPSVSAKTTVTASAYKPETFEVTLKANRVTNAFYSIDGAAAVAYEAGDTITLGGGTAYGETTTLVLTGTSEDDGSTVTRTYTYTRQDEPNVSDGYCIKVKKSDLSTAPYVYIYTNDSAETALAGAWPGTQLTEDPTDSDYWIYENEDIDAETSTRVILSSGSWRSTADMQPGLVVQGAVEYDLSSNSFEEIPYGEAGRVDVRYVNEDGELLKSVYRVGAVGRKYTTSAATISGATLVSVPDDAEGTFTTQSTVTYVYSGGEPIEDYQIKSVSAAADGTTVTINASAATPSGSIKYMYTYDDPDEGEVLLSNFTDANTYVWTDAPTGTYTVRVYTINNGTILTETAKVTVTGTIEDHDATCPSKKFADLDTSAWYHTYTDFAIEKGYFAGYNGTSNFAPNEAVTRGVVINILYKMAGSPEVDESYEIPCTDVSSSDYCYDAVRWAYYIGLTNGYQGTNRFAPWEKINRETMANMLATYMKLVKGVDVSEDISDAFDANGLNDVNSISSWAQDGVAWMVANGYMTGANGSKQFSPTASATRAAFAGVLYKMYDELVVD